MSQAAIISMCCEFACFIIFYPARQQASCSKTKKASKQRSCTRKCGRLGLDAPHDFTFFFIILTFVLCVGILRQIDNCFLGWLRNPSPGASRSSSAASRRTISGMLGGRAGGAAEG